MKDLKEDDIVKIEDAYVRDNQGRKEIHLNDRSSLTINPAGEKIDEVKQYTTTRKKITDLKEGDESIEIFGTIVQAFDLRFFEICPDCNKRARPHQDHFVCEEHNKVTPIYSYVLNIVVDDGSLPGGVIRATFFRNQAERLLNLTNEQMLKFKADPQAFQDTKSNLLGNTIKLVGRVNKNAMFDRLEFMTQLVFTDPDPEHEIKRLKEEKHTVNT